MRLQVLQFPLVASSIAVLSLAVAVAGSPREDLSPKRFADMVSQHMKTTGKREDDLVDALKFLKHYRGENRSNWMSSLPEKVTKMPLTEIAIPGSHDSFTVKLHYNWPLGPGFNKHVRKAINLIHKFTSSPTNTQKIIYNWGVTQSLTLLDQLTAGIRYFDFRVAGFLGRIQLLHTLYADDTLSSFREIDSFLRKNKKEVVIIDINHFYEMNKARHRKLLGEIKQVFGERLVPEQSYSQLTLENLWKNNQQVIILYHHGASSRESVWGGSGITSHWPNTNKISKALRKLDRWSGERKYSAGFWVTQGILTARAADIAPGSFQEFWTGITTGDWSSMKRELGIPMCKAIANWVSGKKIGKEGINIVIADFVEENNFIPSVLALNN